MLPGHTVDQEIAWKLESADLVLVLVTPSFIRSEYCYDIEMRKAVERHNSGQARVIPVVLRPCQWQLTPLKDLLAMPTDGRAVTEWPNRDTAFNDVAKAIAELATTMQRTGSKVADPVAIGAKPVLGGGAPGGLFKSHLLAEAKVSPSPDIRAVPCALSASERLPA